MKQIETEFTQKGWQLRQLSRVDDIAIYERSKEGAAPHYEVVRIKSHNGFQIPGTEQMSEPAEYYPSEKSWGVDGFTFSTIKDASERLAKLTQQAL
jgi:hypothetical protein